MASLFDRTQDLEDIGEIYRRMTMNCPNPSSTSKRLWELRRVTDIASHNSSDETMLEKAVVMLAANGHLHGWFNQCPTASGIGDPSRNRHSNVDLVHWSEPTRHARLIELKWRSNHPAEAVQQVLRYGAAYVFCRMHRNQLPLQRASVMDARHVALLVVAPARYCRAPGLQDDLARARQALKRFDVGSRMDGLSMSLDVLAFPDWFEALPFVDGADVRTRCDHGELTDTGQKIRAAFEALHSLFPDPEDKPQAPDEVCDHRRRRPLPMFDAFAMIRPVKMRRMLTRVAAGFLRAVTPASAQDDEATRYAAEQGIDADAQVARGVRYANGEGVPQDAAEAVRWFRPAAEQGHAGARCILGIMYFNGEGVPKDTAEAARWFHLATAQGLGDAQNNLGEVSATGEGVPQDIAEAVLVGYYRLAAAQGLALAQYGLGVMYATGELVPQDDAEAARWYRLAAAHGHADAQYNLGVRYATGEGVPQDAPEAARWYRLAAAQGHADAQAILGQVCANGEGVPKDAAEAARWYRLAAEQGHAAAQTNLGIMYADGRGVPQNDAEAVRWYRLAAAQGPAAAQYNLGEVYADGRGVPQDAAEAARWYRLAAEQGLALAQYNLGIMYDNGRGVPQDDVSAHMWFNLATAAGAEEARKGRDSVAARMTREQIAEAQARAREWANR